MAGVGDSMVEAFDQAWSRLGERVAGLADDEYLWEPVAGCWSIRPDDAGRWRADGDGDDPPGPAPFTTIAWRLAHLAGSAVGGSTERLFPSLVGVGGPPDPPAAASGVASYLTACYAPWRKGLASYTDDDWFRSLGAAWGPYATSTHLDLVLHIYDEVVHHAAEVGVLRDLFAHQPR